MFQKLQVNIFLQIYLQSLSNPIHSFNFQDSISLLNLKIQSNSEISNSFFIQIRFQSSIWLWNSKFIYIQILQIKSKVQFNFEILFLFYISKFKLQIQGLNRLWNSFIQDSIPEFHFRNSIQNWKYGFIF
jgi:hypothetical protein